MNTSISTRSKTNPTTSLPAAVSGPGRLRCGAFEIRSLAGAFLFVFTTFATSMFAQEGFTSLFNGKDLTGWDGDPKLWKVENGIVIGTCGGPDAPANNSFLIWRGGKVTD